MTHREAIERLIEAVEQLLDHVEDPDIERPAPGQCTICRSYRQPVHDALRNLRTQDDTLTGRNGGRAGY